MDRYTDYFSYLYRTIEARLRGELASRWEDANIEFIFSVPTTWKPIPTVERFRKTISAAGFGSCANHTASIGLTEAEAAAVHTARSMPGIFQVSRLANLGALAQTITLPIGKRDTLRMRRGRRYNGELTFKCQHVARRLNGYRIYQSSE